VHQFATTQRRRKHRPADVPASEQQPVVQRKLRVGSVDDPTEREADMVADRVMAALNSTSSAPAFADHPVGHTAPAVGRIARSPHTPSRETTSGSDATSVSDETAGRIRRMSGGGSPLPDPILRSMEGAFGTDFSKVRLHQGSESSQLNDDLSARAFTTGSDVFLGRSVDTDSKDGTRLMAHELAHVVQQGAATVRRSALDTGVIRRYDGKKPSKRAQLSNINESAHYGSSRDKEHVDGKAALLAADGDGSISKKLYNRHNAKDTAIITTFKTSRKGTFIVVGTFADVARGTLTYDTAYLSKTVAATGVPGKKYYNPDAPIIEL